MKILYTLDFIAQVNAIHDIFPRGLEWSGFVMCEKKEEPTTIFIPKIVVPLNLGSAAYTELKYKNHTDEVVEYLSENEGLFMANIHSHHSMATNFSHTDLQDLRDNADPFYLSIIVNYSQQYSAKIAYPVEVEQKYSWFGVQNNQKVKEIKIVDLIPEYESISINEQEKNRLIALCNAASKRKEEKQKLYNLQNVQNTSYYKGSKKQFQQNIDWEFEHWIDEPFVVRTQDEEIDKNRLLKDLNVLFAEKETNLRSAIKKVHNKKIQFKAKSLVEEALTQLYLYDDPSLNAEITVLIETFETFLSL